MIEQLSDVLFLTALLGGPLWFALALALGVLVGRSIRRADRPEPEPATRPMRLYGTVPTDTVELARIP